MHALPLEGSAERERVVDFVWSCASPQRDAFGGNRGHDANLLYTLRCAPLSSRERTLFFTTCSISAIQIMALLDRMDQLDGAAIAAHIAALQQPDGSFFGDRWGEVDTRFSYIAIMGLSLLGRLDSINVDAAVDYILACRNFDGAFGAVPHAESHAGQTFCCVAALAIAGALDRIDKDRLGWWLAERQVSSSSRRHRGFLSPLTALVQLPCGGLNGRPEKKEDVCYSWWVLSSLALLGKLDWIDGDALARYILSCQDAEVGAIADRPENQGDVFHLFFGVCGLSLLGTAVGCQLKAVDPAYALPVETLRRLRVGAYATH